MQNSYLTIRREKLAKQIGDGVVILSSDGHDQHHFYYLTDREAEGDVLILAIEGGCIRSQYYLHQSKSAHEQLWHGLDTHFAEIQKTTHGLEVFELQKLAQIRPDLKLKEVKKEDLHQILAKMRLVKDKEEIHRMKKAAQISADAHQDLSNMSLTGLTEIQVAATFDYLVKMKGAEKSAYNSIAGSDFHSTILHHKATERVLVKNDLLLLDAGARYKHYCADITRSFALGKMSDLQKEVYQVVQLAQQEAIAQAKPGKTLADIDEAARYVIRDFAKTIQMDDKEIYPHSTSHWLGLEVHDPKVGDDRNLKLEAGMTFTVEPGIYLHPWISNKNTKYSGIGIRIEDDILITKSGHEVLSKNFSKGGHDDRP